MPRTEDGFTLADILQAPEQSYIEEDEKVPAAFVTDIVHTALRECRIEEQEYAVMAFGLDYTSVPNEKQLHRSLLKQERRSDNLLRSIKRVFRKHPQVQELIQREMYVL